MLEHAQALLAWIAEHPNASMVLLFVVTMIDALFLIGAFIPAAVVLFGMGALVALGSLELWPTALIAATGALTGDGISFALGRHYGERLFESRLLRRYPDFVAGGRRFFERHGGKGVVLARFLGPVRSITPAFAGAAGMRTWVFLLVDFFAALLWALVYLVPGVLFGASLGLAAEVATRLAGLLVLNLLLLILGIWAARAAISLFNTRAEKWMRELLEWSRRHRRLGRFGPGLADPSQPEMPALLTVALLLLVGGGIWLASFGGVGWRVFPGPFDALVHQTLSDLSTPWGTATAHFIARLGEWPVYGSTAVGVLAVLLWRRRLRAATHWVSALLFGAIVALTLQFVPLLPTPGVFFGAIAPAHAPLRDMIMPTIVYGSAASLFATLRPPRVRSFAYGVAIAVVLLIALARLVLAHEWLSVDGFSVVMGLLWIAALTLGYRQHGPERLFAGSFALPVLCVFMIAAGMSWGVDRATTHAAASAPVAAPKMVSYESWWNGGWRELPAMRTDVRGRSGRYFDLQWAAPLNQIEEELLAAGWQQPSSLGATDTLRWLTVSTPVEALPVLPQVHAGSHARLTLRQPIDAEHQRLIRLWDSGIHVMVDGALVPVWLGTVIEQRARSFYRLFRYPVAEPAVPMLPPLPARTALTTIRVLDRDGHRLWLMGPPRNIYTEGLPEAPVSAPVPLPAN